MVTVQRMRGPTARLKVHLAWDISFWVAVAFVVGSACWICNGHLLYTPISPTPSPPHANAAAWLAFAGGTAFEIGAYLAYVESLPINTGHEDLYQEFHEHQANLTGDGKGVPGVSVKEEAVELKKTRQRSRWIGTGSLRDIGFLASAVQLFAASVFWISTLTGLPNVIPTLAEKNTPVSVVLFWKPQVIGGTGFMVASVLLMLEEQKKWWRISPLRIGWQVAFWNLVGAIGFTLCGALGYAAVASSKANYQSILSTFWGSWAFMIGSVIQLWETLWREDSKSSSMANAPSPNDKDTPVQKEQSSNDGHAD
ncbi:hypothetical protein PHLGIDRAFT_91841 [Phlebiopsis gigantea 11061_1 CR5-6]|uniref:Integral membrane protein n=1 Tax=Phlebiopsis gigantea (strain 11061_1 CR5-6) TaxID=745531 RepID=A0A0C3NKW3_PHLG1|nr:hypothetical protein PHLGIDRAFT_91841 [Phlebiopsis gigantea 11061_1 CR5-6]